MKISISAATAFLCAIFIVLFRSLYPPVNILSWDVFGYYLYLPAVFMHHDPGLHDTTWLNAVIDKYQTTATFYQATQLPDGSWVMKYPMGLAVLNMPGFGIAWLVSKFSSFSSDGFSLPFQYAWAVTGLVFSVVGVLMLRKILLEYFNDKVVAIVLVIIVFGTNYFQLTAFEGFLSHNYLFTIYTYIIWFTIRWHQNQRKVFAVATGFFIGLAVLCRPSEMVATLVPLLWAIGSRQSLNTKWQLVKSHPSHVAMLAIAGMAAVLPQLIYWKHISGQWFFYSYNNPGEGFEFAHPYILQVLFSFRKGWFVYTPLMLFAVAGFIFLYRKNKAIFPVVVTYFLVNLYVVASWTCWWYAGGSYSQRALLSSYVLLAIPMGYFISWLLHQQKFTKAALATILALLMVLNLFQSWQWVHGVIDRTRMTKAYYFAIFGKTHATEADRAKLLIDRPTDENEVFTDEKNYTGRTALYLDFESQSSNDSLISRDTVYAGQQALRLDKAHPFSPGFEMPFNKITSSDHAWIRASVKVFPLAVSNAESASLVVTFQHGNEAYHYRAESIALPKYAMQPGKWNFMQMEYLTPEARSAGDICKVYFWLQGVKPVLIDDLKVEIFVPKH